VLAASHVQKKEGRGDDYLAWDFPGKGGKEKKSKRDSGVTRSSFVLWKGGTPPDEMWSFPASKKD